MTDQAAMLAAVFAAPADDAPRLVYADWLDEHGEPDRAEFIRVQVALRRAPECDSDPPCGLMNSFLPPHVPDGWCENCCRRHPLERREAELLDAMHRTTLGRDWWPNVTADTAGIGLDPLQTRCMVAGSPAAFYWRGGFIHEAELSAEAFLGAERPCPDCEDAPLCPETNVVECSTCDSTGVVHEPGAADQLLAAHPVPFVELTTEPADRDEFRDVTTAGDERRVYCHPRWPRVEFWLPSRASDPPLPDDEPDEFGPPYHEDEDPDTCGDCGATIRAYGGCRCTDDGYDDDEDL